MASTGDKSFESWLNKKLRELNTDESVFCSYITGILDGDESEEEKIDSLEGILSEIIENDIKTVLNEIMDKWKEFSIENDKELEHKEVEDVDTKLARLMESKTLATVVQKQYTPEELKIREQILSQYSQLSADEDEDDEGGEKSAVASSDPTMVKNTNALDVQQANKERREQARLDSANKKLKDKEDREKQKQMREEKKEKRKTVKGERRR